MPKDTTQEEIMSLCCKICVIFRQDDAYESQMQSNCKYKINGVKQNFADYKKLDRQGQENLLERSFY